MSGQLQPRSACSHPRCCEPNDEGIAACLDCGALVLVWIAGDSTTVVVDDAEDPS